MKKLKNGFTLIELLVVIAIVGILAVTLVPRIRLYLARSKDAEAVSVLGAARVTATTILMQELETGTLTMGVDRDNSPRAIITLAQIRNEMSHIFTDRLYPQDGLIVIGGSRATASGNITFGGHVGLSSYQATAAIPFPRLLSSSTDPITYAVVLDRQVPLFLAPENPVGLFDTSGTAWSSY